MTDVAAPRSINYTDTLPLAIASTQNRRSFYPQNGQSFTDTGSNIIRIDVNADGLLDTQQSYLEFTLRNMEANTRALDQGHVWIKRLTIESGGVILEDINNYNRLVGGILQPAQGSAAYTGEMQVAQGGSSQSGDVQGNEVVTGGAVDVHGIKPMAGFQNLFPAVIAQAGGGNVVPPQTAFSGTGVIDVTPAQVVGQYHLACGFLNMDKYLPLVLMGQGFTIQLELEVGANIGIMTGGGAGVPAAYEIHNVKYVAHIVEMQRDFYDMLRNLQSQSGGSLMIGSSTFRHFSHTYTPAAAGGTEEINITARVRSLENLLWCSTVGANVGNSALYNLANSSALGSVGGSYNVFVGAIRYPSNQVSWNNINNKGEAYQELRKCFGALGSINHGGLLNACTYLSSSTGSEVALNGGIPRYAPMGISFKSWRHELEDGIDTSSSALPVRLSVTTDANGAAAANTVDIFAQATVLFYFNMDGTVSANV